MGCNATKKGFLKIGIAGYFFSKTAKEKPG